MLYFAYGSNMLRSRLEERVGEVVDRGVAKLKEYKIKFNKKGKDGSGKTNITLQKKSEVWGVGYELTDEQINLLDGIEDGYKRDTINVILENKKVQAEIYFALPEKIDGSLLPTIEYLDFLMSGAQEHDFPKIYLEFLQSIKAN